MLEIITQEALITKYQNQFIQKLKVICTEKIKCRIGHKGGGNEQSTVFYSSKYNFWFANFKNRNRYWNAFGINEPLIGGTVFPIVEINPPFKGIDRRIGGAFGSNRSGDIYVLHRGKIGGGREGIGKSLFFDKYSGTIVQADEGKSEEKFAIVTSLKSKKFAKQISDFISEVNQIKNLSSEEKNVFSFLNRFQYTNEPTGTRKAPKYTDEVVNLKHPIVVNALKHALKNRNITTARDRNRDLFIHRNHQIKALFEIKTSSSPQDIYQAVGQLLIYSIPFKSDVELIMVLPQKLKLIVENRLNELGINLLYYTWKNETPIFFNLEELIFINFQ